MLDTQCDWVVPCYVVLQTRAYPQICQPLYCIPMKYWIFCGLKHLCPWRANDSKTTLAANADVEEPQILSAGNLKCLPVGLPYDAVQSVFGPITGVCGFTFRVALSFLTSSIFSTLSGDLSLCNSFLFVVTELLCTTEVPKHTLKHWFCRVEFPSGVQVPLQ